MRSLEILYYPDPALRENCSPVENIDDELKSLAESMIEAMYRASGIGLAAPQVGVLKNLLIIDSGAQIKNGPAIVFINPKITSVNNVKVTGEEGCLSIPRIYANVNRQEAVEVKGTDINEKEITFEFNGLLARAVQHEIDHFSGVLFWDYLGKVKRNLLKNKFKKLQREMKTEPVKPGELF